MNLTIKEIRELTKQAKAGLMPIGVAVRIRRKWNAFSHDYGQTKSNAAITLWKEIVSITDGQAL